MGGMFLSLFDEVHRSNMSKACATLNEAEETRRFYRENKDIESVIESVQDNGKWLVCRKSDRKNLKSVRYSPANLVPIIVLAQQQSPTYIPLLVSPGALSSVAEFHTLFRCPVVETPQMPSADRCQLRVSLLQEKVQELEVAIAQSNLIEVADALADIQYVLSGAVLEFGMGSTFQTLFDEVHRSNMSKACATPEEVEETRRHYLQNKKTESYAEQVEPGKWLVYRQGDNKALKSVRYSPANLGGVLIRS
jgi:predicted HAD superfamily Cof-like phosphohydrolase